MTLNNVALRARCLAELVDGELEGNPNADFLRARADSRLCCPGDLYVALAGERTDGNYFLRDAWQAGATVVLADSSKVLPFPPSGKALVKVGDPLQALQDFARFYRSSCSDLRVIAVTGSNGKTTTKEILAAILRSWIGEDLLVSEGNYNSEIGLPLSLIDLRPNHRLAVMELGIDTEGEMQRLASMAQPDVVVLTNVGRAHVGKFASREALAREKRAVFSHAKADTLAILPAEDSWRDFLAKNFLGQIWVFSEGHLEISENSWPLVAFDSWEERGLSGQDLVLDGRKISFSLPGRHNRLNAIAAVGGARAVGVPEAMIDSGLEAVRPLSWRSEVLRGELTVIKDFYNANPESLAAALALFQAEEKPGRRVIVLGEMLDLGEETEKAVEEASEALAVVDPDALFLFGKTWKTAEKILRERGCRVWFFANFSALEFALEIYLYPGDLVLLKGSRGTALERLEGILEGVARV